MRRHLNIRLLLMYHQFWFIFAESAITRSGPGLKCTKVPKVLKTEILNQSKKGLKFKCASIRRKGKASSTFPFLLYPFPLSSFKKLLSSKSNQSYQARAKQQHGCRFGDGLGLMIHSSDFSCPEIQISLLGRKINAQFAIKINR